MKNECENLTLYFYGELEPERAAAFKAHLPHCPRCQSELLFLRRTQEALVPPAAPQTVVQGVLAPAKAQGGYLWQVLKPALATVLVLGLGIYFFVSGPRLHSFIDDGKDFVAYISAEADEEYNTFAREFEAFENEF